MSEQHRDVSGRLVVYCRSWCGDCQRAFRWLDEREIDYVKRDVEDDIEARAFAEAVNAGRLHTPTFAFGEDTCVDFDTVWLCDVLGVE